MEYFDLLIVGDANSQYIHSFTLWSKKIWPKISVKIIHTGLQNLLRRNDQEIFDEIFETLDNSTIISKIIGLKSIYRAWKVYKLIKSKSIGTDAILVHLAAPWLALVSKYLKNETKNYTIALWGSDFYRTKSKKALSRIFHYADNIIIGSPQMIEDFEVVFGRFIQKVHLCYFGNEPIENLKYFKDTSISRQESCHFFNLTDDKFNVAIGYSGSKFHQHLSILKELLILDYETAKKIRIILPMTYGLDTYYLNEVIKACEILAIEFRIFKNFMSENEIAHLRNLTDIMINLQTTDAFSGSMREVLYCGGIVINGSWLPYRFLKEMEIYFEEINSINDVSGKLIEVISDYSNVREKCRNNSDRIYNTSSWSKVIFNWKEVIELNH